MRDVVVIGGGLSGLSACYELEKLGVRYTVIEVKRRFGGAIRTTAVDGFLMDASSFVFRPFTDQPWLAELNLADRITTVGDGASVFNDGSESLIRSLAGKLRGGRLMRMAVSSIGRWRGRHTICLENGMMYDAGAVIVAAPARYASRMLYNLAPEVAERLSGFRYDSILRVSLGYHKRDLPSPIGGACDTLFPFVFATDQPGRVPDADYLLIQAGLRGAADLPSDVVIRDVTTHFGWNADPIAFRVDHWPEADHLKCNDASHCSDIRQIRAALPAGISLTGSDYCLEAPQMRGIARLDERLGAGKQAARAAVAYLKARRSP